MTSTVIECPNLAERRWVNLSERYRARGNWYNNAAS